MKRPVLVFALLFAFAATGCSGSTTTTVQPRLSVYATHVDDDGTPLMDFGPVPVLLKRELTLVLANTSRATLELKRLELRDETGMYEIDEAIGPTLVGSGDSVEVRITFRPEQHGW